jgi:hypothetical protein
MKNFNSRRGQRGVLLALLCAAIAPLTGCALLTAPVLGFIGFNAVYESVFLFLPLRSAIGGIIRDTFVSIF